MSIDLNVLIKEANLNKGLLAAQLFPDKKHPASALSRVISGKQELNASQIAKLSAIVGVPISALFDKRWNMTSTTANQLEMRKWYYTARIDLTTFTGDLYLDGALQVQRVVLPQNIKLTDLTAQLDRLFAELLEQLPQEVKEKYSLPK